jgi:tRNA modification GTPase
MLAARGLAGGTSGRLQELRHELLTVIASLEVALDFPDDVSEPDHAETCRRLNDLQGAAARLWAAAAAGSRAHGGIDIAIVGPPNAGKSSLFNALLGMNRAIVTPRAGTTRDVVDGTTEVAGVPVRLLDTAGIGAPQDEIDAEAMRRAREMAERSDLLLVVLDGSEPIGSSSAILEETRGRARIVVLSKSDLGDAGGPPPAEPAIRASVKSERGLEALLERLVREVVALTGEDGDEGGVVASLRQLKLLESLSQSLEAATERLAGAPVEVALVDLRSALEAASALLGIEVGDAILDTVFARFCVGK